MISNIGTITRMADISFSGNGFTCPVGMFLDYNMVSGVLQHSWTSMKAPCACGLTYCFLELFRPNTTVGSPEAIVIVSDIGSKRELD